MIPSPDAEQHEYAEQLLDGYILGTLSADDHAWMDEHLRRCPQCQQEVTPLLRAVQALPFGAPEPDVQMSDEVWNRIERSITGDNDPVPLDLHRRQDARAESTSPARLSSPQWLMVAALMLVSLIGGVLLAQGLPRLGGDEVQTQQIALQFTDPNITATGELRYLPDQEVFVLNVEGMPPAPEGHVYQAWLIDNDGPVAAGVMNTGLGELASTGDRNQFETFAITVEPGPFGNEAPTTEPVMVAPLHDPEAS